MHIHILECAHSGHHMQSQESVRSKILHSFPPPLPITCETTLRIRSVVWSPYLKKDIFHLENVQKFGLRMTTKMWTYPYHYLLYRSHLNSLESRRSIARLCTLFKLLHQLDYAQCTVSLRSNHSHRTNHHLILCQPFCRSNFLTLNRKKCKFMVLSRRQSPSYPDIPLMIEDHPLEQVLSLSIWVYSYPVIYPGVCTFRPSRPEPRKC